MSIAAGAPISASDVLRLRPAKYTAKATSTVAASSTNVDVPSCSITFNVETSGAKVRVGWIADFDPSGAPGTGANSVRALTDGATASPVTAVWATGATDTSSARWGGVSAYYETTSLSVGSHTIKLQATTTTNVICGTFTTLNVEVEEVV